MSDTKAKLQSLHDTLAGVLLDAITEGVPVKDDETGKVHKASASAAILNVARQFLKDNQIEAIPVKGTNFGNLATVLPFSSLDDLADEKRHQVG